ncbi:unnamed protein product [Moneuplotes crassus]|uniref:Uncharacterized protein n=1 Tax=Euplotes crassus TaxID=5936 RepID=A0AAD1XM94_EUPCR|nr:unnamed protein product [Moneuplotes crassus]
MFIRNNLKYSFSTLRSYCKLCWQRKNERNNKIKYSLKILDEEHKNKKRIPTGLQFQEYNVLQLIKINECKDEIRSLIKPLKRSKKLVLSKHSIFRSYVYEKLVIAKEKESKVKRDHKHNIRLRLLDDIPFYHLLCREFKMKNKNKSRHTRFKSKKHSSMKNSQERKLSSTTELQSLMNDLRKANRIKKLNKENRDIKIAPKVDVVLESVKEYQKSQDEEIKSKLKKSTAMNKFISAKNMQNDPQSLIAGSSKDIINITLENSPKSKRNIIESTKNIKIMPIPMSRKPKKSFVKVESFSVASIVDLLDSDDGSLAKNKKLNDIISSDKKQSDSEVIMNQPCEEDESQKRLAMSENRQSLSSSKNTGERSDSMKKQANKSKFCHGKTRFSKDFSSQESDLNMEKKQLVLPKMNKWRNALVNKALNQTMQIKRRRITRSIDIEESKQLNSYKKRTSKKRKKLNMRNRSIDDSFIRLVKTRKRRIFTQIDFSKILACSDPPSNLKKLVKRRKFRKNCHK